MTIITPTGDRPQCFALCEKWMARQTLKPDRWIVVDDGHTPTQMTLGQEVIRLHPRPDEHTLARNLLTALEHLGPGWAGELCMIEDDDWYAPDYLATMDRRLDEVDLVGEGNALYYRLDIPGYRWMGNMHHASLAATAVKGAAVKQMKTLCWRMIGQPAIDLALWRTFDGSKRVFPNQGPVTQFKGMPGRRGHSTFHLRRDKWTADPEERFLQCRVRADASKESGPPKAKNKE
jgi:hypothetical protein